MKRYIMIGVSFFTFVLISGCSKSEEDKCKDKGWYWNESTKECKEKAPDGTESAVTTATAETKESCESKSGIWNDSNSTCKVIDYFMVIYPEDYDSQNGQMYYLVRVEKELIEYHDTPMNFRDQGGLLFRKGDCIKVHKSFLSNVRVQLRKSGGFRFQYTDVCNNLAPDTGLPCYLGVYEIMSGGHGLKRIHPTEERTDCKVLELEE